MSTDGWQPDQYARFAAERSAPARDLMALIAPVPGGAAVDFGCGSGQLTVELHHRLQAARTIGIDRSAAMLAQAADHHVDGVTFRQGDLRDTTGLDPQDVVFANAALHWVPDHRQVLAGWTALLRDGGQVAVQMPANVDHVSHRTAAEVATEEPFLSAMGGTPPPDPVLDVLRPEEYAELLDELGYGEQHVRLQVYPHHLKSTAEVVEWVKGTSLVRFRERLPAELYEEFLDRYRTRLLERLGDRAPYFYAFKRILLWGRR